MKIWMNCGLCLAVLAAGSITLAADGPLFGPPLGPAPTPIVIPDEPFIIPNEVVVAPAGGEIQPTLKPIPETGILPETEPVPLYTGCELFDSVRYKNLKKIAPCAVEMIVAVRTPCGCKKDPCKPCVLVKICVPPCNDCPKVKIRKQGDKVIYDYGKYAVELTSKKGEVIVAYHKAWF